MNPNGDGLYKKNVAGGKLNVGRIPNDTTSMILHTRNGTHGSATDNDNNHPVESPSGNIRLVHNGVIYNHREMRELLGKAGKSLPDVDSSVIPAMIEEFGLESTSEIGGYAACAWFDRETGDTIHLARFHDAPVVFAELWDGSWAFASTEQILGRALAKADVAWFGMYPQHFVSMSEGEYFQLMGGEIIGESTVAWNKYHRSAYDWHGVTSSATTARPAGFGNVTPAANQPHTKLADTAKDKPMAWDEDDEESAEAQRTRKAISALYSTSGQGVDDLTDEEYDNWVKYGSIDGIVDAEWEELEDDDERPVDLVGTRPLYYTDSHDGDYDTYTRLSGLLTALSWNAGLSTENLLVGPEEGDLRWINHFKDVGILGFDKNDDPSQLSWVDDDTVFQPVSNFTPPWLKDGIVKLRQLVGS